MKQNQSDINFKKNVKIMDHILYKSSEKMKWALLIFFLLGIVGMMGLLGLLNDKSTIAITISIFGLTMLGGITIIFFQYCVELEILKNAKLCKEYESLRNKFEELKLKYDVLQEERK